MSTAPVNVFDTNKVRLAPLLATLRKVGIGHWIGGKRAESADSRTFETCSPVDLTRIAELARGSATDIDRAAQAAKAAFPA